MTQNAKRCDSISSLDQCTLVQLHQLSSKQRILSHQLCLDLRLQHSVFLLQFGEGKSGLARLRVAASQHCATGCGAAIPWEILACLVRRTLCKRIIKMRVTATCQHSAIVGWAAIARNAKFTATGMLLTFGRRILLSHIGTARQHSSIICRAAIPRECGATRIVGALGCGVDFDRVVAAAQHVPVRSRATRTRNGSDSNTTRMGSAHSIAAVTGRGNCGARRGSTGCGCRCGLR
mmetsp:Transcript_40835/g.98046  ORF Transcript_40835/g.98046 Transcript_40835/m.98046 type:complete len:234 (-) Transcript_40835:116-817(-)